MADSFHKVAQKQWTQKRVRGVHMLLQPALISELLLYLLANYKFVLSSPPS